MQERQSIEGVSCLLPLLRLLSPTLIYSQTAARTLLDICLHWLRRLAVNTEQLPYGLREAPVAASNSLASPPSLLTTTGAERSTLEPADLSLASGMQIKDVLKPENNISLARCLVDIVRYLLAAIPDTFVAFGCFPLPECVLPPWSATRRTVSLTPWDSHRRPSEAQLTVKAAHGPGHANSALNSHLQALAQQAAEAEQRAMLLANAVSPGVLRTNEGKVVLELDRSLLSGDVAAASKAIFDEALCGMWRSEEHILELDEHFGTRAAVDEVDRAGVQFVCEWALCSFRYSALLSKARKDATKGLADAFSTAGAAAGWSRIFLAASVLRQRAKEISNQVKNPQGLPGEQPHPPYSQHRPRGGAIHAAIMMWLDKRSLRVDGGQGRLKALLAELVNVGLFDPRGYLQQLVADGTLQTRRNPYLVAQADRTRRILKHLPPPPELAAILEPPCGQAPAATAGKADPFTTDLVADGGATAVPRRGKRGSPEGPSQWSNLREQARQYQCERTLALYGPAKRRRGIEQHSMSSMNRSGHVRHMVAHGKASPGGSTDMEVDAKEGINANSSTRSSWKPLPLLVDCPQSPGAMLPSGAHVKQGTPHCKHRSKQKGRFGELLGQLAAILKLPAAGWTGWEGASRTASANAGGGHATGPWASGVAECVLCERQRQALNSQGSTRGAVQLIDDDDEETWWAKPRRAEVDLSKEAASAPEMAGSGPGMAASSKDFGQEMLQGSLCDAQAHKCVTDEASLEERSVLQVCKQMGTGAIGEQIERLRPREKRRLARLLDHTVRVIIGKGQGAASTNDEEGLQRGSDRAAAMAPANSGGGPLHVEPGPTTVKHGSLAPAGAVVKKDVKGGRHGSKAGCRVSAATGEAVQSSGSPALQLPGKATGRESARKATLAAPLSEGVLQAVEQVVKDGPKWQLCDEQLAWVIYILDATGEIRVLVDLLLWMVSWVPPLGARKFWPSNSCLLAALIR